MSKFRLIFQGQGVGPDGEWFGFYAAREFEADTEEEACNLAHSSLQTDWEGPSKHLGTIAQATIVAAWSKGRTSFRSLPNGGHTFYNDDLEAQIEALRLETRAASTPRAISTRLLADLA